MVWEWVIKVAKKVKREWRTELSECLRAKLHKAAEYYNQLLKRYLLPCLLVQNGLDGMILYQNLQYNSLSWEFFQLNHFFVPFHCQKDTTLLIDNHKPYLIYYFDTFLDYSRLISLFWHKFSKYLKLIAL